MLEFNIVEAPIRRLFGIVGRYARLFGIVGRYAKSKARAFCALALHPIGFFWKIRAAHRSRYSLSRGGSGRGLK